MSVSTEDSRIRITFSCTDELKNKLTKKANDEGIPRSQLIVELLETSLGIEGGVEYRDPAVNRLLFDLQERLTSLESWRREIKEWASNTDINTNNLEATVAALLNEDVNLDISKDVDSKGQITKPK